MMKDMYRKGISEIARQTGRDRKTVRKAVQAGLAPAGAKPARRKVRERKLGDENVDDETKSATSSVALCCAPTGIPFVS